MGNSITLIHVDVPMVEPFRISSGNVSSKESIVIRIERDGIEAWGEASPMSGGFYSAETPESCFRFLAEQAVPLLIADGRFDPAHIVEWKEKHPGDPFSWTGLDGALWDYAVQSAGTSFSERLGANPGPVRSGLAVGIYPSIDKLLAACERHLRDGYHRLKIKIEPGWDIEPLRAVRETFGEIPLMVDANAAYREEHFEHLAQLDAFNLMMIEQPLAADDLIGHQRLQAQIQTAICIDESAKNLSAVQRAIELEACKIVNLKIQRIGSLSETVAIHDLCQRHGVPNWMGTMPELGIAGLHAVYAAGLPNCTYPTDVEASSRWFVEDIVDPPIQVTDGDIELPTQHRQRPHVNPDTLNRYTVHEQTFVLR